MAKGEGKFILFQKPNLPLAVWFVSLLLGKIFTTGSLHSLFGVISFGAIFTWAWLEIFYGENNFRRGLGIVVLIFSVVNRIQ